MTVLALVAALLYAALPWWVPTGWLAGRVAEALSEQLGAEVTVGDVAVSWSEGLRVDGVAVANPPGFGSAPAVTVEQIRMDFSPLSTLLTGRIDWMAVDRPTLRVVLDAAGRCNLQRLRPPVISVLTRHITVQNAKATLSLPGDPNRLTLNVSGIQILAGRLEQFERVTMTASLATPPTNAPMGLTVLTGPAAGDAKARLSFHFGDLDLEALGLRDLLDLPLARLKGICGGRLILPVAPDGNVTDCQLDLRVHDLDAQPRGPDAWLPAIRDAGLAAKLNVDLATQLVDVRSATLRAPGTALTGRGRFHVAMLKGRWLGGQRVWFRGTVNPETIAALLRGDRPGAAAAVRLAGDVTVEVSYDRLDREILATVFLDATAARLVAGPRVLKPAGETLRCTLRASCKPQTWQSVFDQTQLDLGGNRFEGNGALANLRQLIADWTVPDHQWTVEEIGREVAGLDWSGRWRVTELESLRRLHPAAAALDAVELDGPLTGTWRLDHQAGARLAVRLVSGPDAAIRAGELLDKPHGVPLEASVILHAADGLTALQNVRAELNCGRGWASLMFDDVTIEDAADGPGGVADLSGRYRVDRVEEILRYVPMVAEADDKGLTGSVAGDLRLQLAPRLVRGQLTCDATQLDARVADWLHKRQGQPASVLCNVLVEPGGAGNRLDVRASLPGGVLNASVAGRVEAWSARAHLTVANAAWLAEQVPALAACGDRWRFGGAMTAHATVAGAKRRVRGSIDVHADGLDVGARAGRFLKRRGVPLRVVACGDLGAADQTNLAEAILTRLDVVLGANRLDAQGRVAAGDAAHPPEIDLTGQFDVTPDEQLLTLLPELRGPVRRYGLAGRLTGRGRLTGGRAKLDAEGRVDATALAAALPTGGAKPLGMPATFEFVATCRPEQATVRVRHWAGRAGALAGMGDATAVGVFDPAGGEARVRSVQSHFRLWTDRAADLATFLPAAAAFAPAGDVEIQGEAYASATGAGVRYATATFEEFSLLHRGRRVTVSGSALVEGVNLSFDDGDGDRTWTLAPRGSSPAAVLRRIDEPDGHRRWTLAALDPSGRTLAALTGFGRIATDDLHLSAGPSAGTIVMDLRDLLAAPQGAITLLARQIDANDLRQWLVGPRPVPAAPLTSDALAALDARADNLIDLAGQLTSRADVRFDGNIRLLHNWPDAPTGKVLDIHDLAVHTTLKAGVFAFAYQGGFSGGTLIDTYNVDLTAERPKVAAVQRALDLMASKELQPQIDILFPGNQLHGSMSRRIETTLSLREVVGNALDPRRTAFPVGTGKGVFVKGVTLGRAAPRFVTRVFSGLNLVEYPYDRMVNFSEYRPDGSTYNDMIFDGKTYDLYIEGVTDAAAEGRYDVGLILLGSPQTAEWNHRYRQGRIPVFKFSAKLIGGKKIDEQISYPWPNETMFHIFLKNNYVYRLWLARNK